MFGSCHATEKNYAVASAGANYLARFFGSSLYFVETVERKHELKLKKEQATFSSVTVSDDSGDEACHELPAGASAFVTKSTRDELQRRLNASGYLLSWDTSDPSNSIIKGFKQLPPNTAKTPTSTSSSRGSSGSSSIYRTVPHSSIGGGSFFGTIQ
ncbi:hypothetical protein FACS189449_04010 [Alphaproteobacteria bacterium]|nr:hypothetical protein FACS189449_04010 [Alphaproteobacteria bacterium]